ncbi:unnamed protein product [Toxocara canis]|nr:unnamed protein product [Toxocara canis]
MHMPSGGLQIIDSQLCAGAWYKGTGEGDSGGPLQVLHNNVWYQVGITSFGENTHEGLIDQASYPGVFTRVSSYCDFIEKATQALVKCSAKAITTAPEMLSLPWFAILTIVLMRLI